MRHFIVGAGLLVVALLVTFAAASVLQGMAVANKTASSEPFVIDKIRPADTVNRNPRNEPLGGRSVVLANRASSH
jgi:predicted DNA-binding transcriptional regulator AlpA